VSAASTATAPGILAGAAVPVISDALDMLGIAGGLPDLRPVWAGAGCCGPAYPILFEPVEPGVWGPAAEYVDEVPPGSVVLLANGCSGVRPDPKELAAFEEGVATVMETLARQIARDGEGARKLVTIDVAGATTEDAAARIARSIANSPLVKTAFFASDPNLGRILAAIGNAGIAELEASRVDLYLGNVHVVERGARAASYTEEQGKRVMKAAEIPVRVTLGRGVESATLWTCDLSYDYVKINADYRS